MTQFFYFATTMLGGLAFFLYGMNIMSEGLKCISSNKLESILKKATSNDFKGFAFATVITALMQSSSTVTVMLVGLVNSGLLSFYNTFGIIMGTNVGTTLTAWIVSLTGLELSILNPRFFTPFISLLGLGFKLIGKTPKKKYIGQSLMGFSILMYGMELMSGATLLINDFKGFENFLSTIESPIIALLVSTIFTGIIQSSAATIGIVEALAHSVGITYKMAIPLVLGANIGTCVTPLLSAIGTNKNAKQVVTLHFTVNILGSAICMLIMYPLKLESNVSMTGVAAIHTAFNIISSIIFFPFKMPLLKFCEQIF